MRRFFLALALCCVARVAAAAIAFDAAADLGNNSGSGTFTNAYTVGSGSNRYLIIAFLGDTASDDITGVTYNGVSATLLTKNTNLDSARFVYVYGLANPASGSNTLSITSTNSHYIIVTAESFSGVAQTGQPDSSGIASTTATGFTGVAVSTTVVAANSWVVGVFGVRFTSGGGGNNTASGLTVRVNNAQFNDIALFDSNGAVSTGSFSSAMSQDAGSSSGFDGILVSLSPAGAAPAVPPTRTLMGVGQ